jgi:hypothetical protein
MQTIILGGQSFDIQPPAFGKLRKIITAFNAMRLDANSESSMENAGLIFSLLTSKTPDEIDAMPIGILEMSKALALVPEICGLIEESPLGEAQAAAGGTQSTAI